MTDLNLAAYHPTFNVDFTSPSDLQYFNTSYYPWGDNKLPSNGDIEVNKDSALTVTGGALVITATNNHDGTYTSGMINTSGHYGQTYGYFEATMALPQTGGFLSSFWMLPTGQYYPEYDPMEQPNNNGAVNQVWQGASWGNTNHHGYADAAPGTNVYQGYHSYGVLRDDTGITFYIDRHASMHMDPSDGMPGDMYGIFNLMVGTAWTGAPQADSAQLFIDNIQAWQPGPTATLSLALSEDAWLGDAQAEISIDGKVLGQATVTAQRGLATQAVAYALDVAPGPHSVSVTFLNDAYAGTGYDRNLFVEGITLGGTSHPDAQAALWWNRTATFTL